MNRLVSFLCFIVTSARSISTSISEKYHPDRLVEKNFTRKSGQNNRSKHKLTPRALPGSYFKGFSSSLWITNLRSVNLFKRGSGGSDWTGVTSLESRESR